MPKGVSTPTQKGPKTGFNKGKWGESANRPRCTPLPSLEGTVASFKGDQFEVSIPLKNEKMAKMANFSGMGLAALLFVY